MLQHPEPPFKGANKPSLLSLSGDAESETSRILATLEDGRPNKLGHGFRLDRRVVVISLLALIGVIAAITMWHSASRPIAPVNAGPKITRITPAAQTAASEENAGAVSPADLKPESTAALITNDPLSPAALAAVSASAAASQTPNAAASRTATSAIENSDAPSALNAAPTETVATTASASAAVSKTDQPTDPFASVAATHHSSSSANRASRNAIKTAVLGSSASGNSSARHASKNSVSAAGKAARTTQPVDSDVALLTALVANDSGQAVPLATTGSRVNGHPERSLQLASVGNTSNQVESGNARNEDIVERKPGDSSASLLQRCRQLGFLEGELCRWRICSERWNSDAACRAQQDKTQAARGN